MLRVALLVIFVLGVAGGLSFLALTALADVTED